MFNVFFCFADVLGFNSEMLDFSSLGDAVSAVLESSAATWAIAEMQGHGYKRDLNKRTHETFFEAENQGEVYSMMLSIARFLYAKGIPVSK